MAFRVLNWASRSVLVNSVPSASTTVKSSVVRRSQVAESAFATASSRARMASRSSAGTCAAIAVGRRHDNVNATRNIRALDILSLRFVLRPNGVRLSCAALLWFSQLQFYYDGRRQLQPLVRLRTNRWS